MFNSKIVVVLFLNVLSVIRSAPLLFFKCSKHFCCPCSLFYSPFYISPLLLPKLMQPKIINFPFCSPQLQNVRFPQTQAGCSSDTRCQRTGSRDGVPRDYWTRLPDWGWNHLCDLWRHLLDKNVWSSHHPLKTR